MAKYARLNDGTLTYVNAKFINLNGVNYVSPSDATLAANGIYKVTDIMEDGVTTYDAETNTILNYIGAPKVASEVETKIASIKGQLANNDPLILALERLIAANGATDEDKAMAEERIALRTELDELGKPVVTEDGDGSAMNPYKWVDGKAVVVDMWYKTPSDYIWQAIKDGVPSSETDTEYFDVVGL